MIGVDVCLISRIARAIGNERFVERVFTQGEREYCDGKTVPEHCMVADTPDRSTLYAVQTPQCFDRAAYLAALDELGAGITDFNFHDVEITHGKNGAPKVALHGEAEKFANGAKLHVSISHDGDNATAVCMAEVGK